MLGGMGLIESFIFVFFGLGGSIGAPLGMSPAPEDSMMAAVAPDECIAYTTWSGSVTPPADGNVSERWMAQPEVSSSWQKLQAAYFEFNRRNVALENAVVFEAAVSVTRHFLTNAVAIYVAEIDGFEDETIGSVKGGALVDLGDDPSALTESINTVVGHLLESNELLPETIAIDGQEFQSVAIYDEGGIRFTWGMADEHHFALTIGEGEMQRLLAQMKTPPPQWLASLRQRLSVERISSVSWIDGRKFVGLIMESNRQNGMEELNSVFGILGFDQLREIGLVTGLDEKGFLGRAHVRIEGEPGGLFGLASNRPITPEMISRIPNDRMFSLAISASPSRIFELVQELSGLDEFSREGFQTTLRTLNEAADMDLENDVIDRLDENAFLYGSVSLPNPASGWVIGVGASEEMALSDPFEKVIGLIRDNAGDNYELGTSDVNGITVYSYEDKREWGSLNGASWTLAEGELLFSTDKTSMRRHMRREALANDALAVDEWYSQVFTSPTESSDGPLLISSLDVSQLLQLVVPLAMPFTGQVIPDDFGFSMNDIPSLDVLTREMKPSVTAIYRTDDGFESVQRQTFPGGSPLNVLPAGSIASLPVMVEMARSFARTESANRMKQMVLATHTYHDANKALPARFNMNDAGEPLLSWRVQILPYLGYSELYDQFHLDEPWDSEHNKTLIDQMPSDFAHPKMKLERGKTVYVSPQGADSVMIDPVDSKTSPKGSRLEAVRDGTSRTALVLEVAEENAVIWTQPSDYPWEDHIQPVTGLYSGWRNGPIIGFCDGSVQSLSTEKVTQIFEALVKANDGEAIDLWDDR